MNYEPDKTEKAAGCLGGAVVVGLVFGLLSLPVMGVLVAALALRGCGIL